MLFSIVVPVYNVEKYLLECLNSIANQTFDDYEVILVDDGSTDISGKICDEFCATHDKFKVFHKQNEGLLKTRLFGRTKMNGEYMISIDSDDFIANNSFKILRNYIEKYNKPDIICFNKYIFCNNQIIKPDDSIDGLSVYSKNSAEILLSLFTSTKLNNLVTKVIKCSLIIKDNTDYSMLCKNQGEDIAQSLFPMLNADSIVLAPDFLYYYRQNNNSITNSSIKIEDVVKYNLLNLHRLKLFYVEKLNLPSEYRHAIIFTNIKYGIILFLKIISKSSNKQEYNKIIAYNWNSVFFSKEELKKNDLNKISLPYKVCYNSILNKRKFIIWIMRKIYIIKSNRSEGKYDG